jgi:predicted ribosomally synthesized peptide with SipW-like signal peptide
MRKILFSLLTIGIVGAVGIAATQAFFRDQEISSNNTFTAGTIDLEIKSQCTYNGVESSECGDWETYNDLTTNDKFFNFTDLKPGDWGENTISLVIEDNPAWMCANIDINQNSHLGKYLNLFWWIDNGDNIYESGEQVLYGGPKTLDEWLTLSDPTHIAGSVGGLPLTFADSVMNWRNWPAPTPNLTPIPAHDEQHLGVGWCFGTMIVNGESTPGFTCSGVGNQDDAQEDVVVGNLTFTVEQYRNNPGFVCPERQPIPNGG